MLFVCIQQRIQTNNAQCHKGIPQTQYTEDFKGKIVYILNSAFLTGSNYKTQIYFFSVKIPRFYA